MRESDMVEEAIESVKGAAKRRPVRAAESPLADADFKEAERNLRRRIADYTKFVDICSTIPYVTREVVMSAGYKIALKLYEKYREPEMNAMLKSIRKSYPHLRKLKSDNPLVQAVEDAKERNKTAYHPLKGSFPPRRRDWSNVHAYNTSLRK